ncbi:Sua5 family C-terminal domain-containing protein [Streptomyces sp. NPDC006527]|uniref:Sua5 family C-terminal domain-containing protein n=1 Tax=Streptomyces sp. NPDC006527 TaxID=3364749 RepID=UPI0036ACB15F
MYRHPQDRSASTVLWSERFTSVTPSAAPGRSQGRAGAGVPGGRFSSPLPRRRPGQGARRGGGSRFHGRLRAQAYGLLRDLDRRGAISSSLRCPVEEGLGLAIANRLSNAAGPRPSTDAVR